MTSSVRATILRVLEGDEDLYQELCREGLLPRAEGQLAAEHVELARITHTLIRELEVNWAGVEIVLRMRSELIATRRQVADLLRVLRESGS